MENSQLARHRQALIQTLNCVSDNCPILLHHLDFYDRVNFPRPPEPADFAKAENNSPGRESAAPKLCAVSNRRNTPLK
jgi:hypothetical protein